MKRNTLIFGTVIGILMTIHMIIMVIRCYENPAFESNDFLGYAAMIVVFSLIYFGIRNYRNHYLNGIISFGKAFKLGTMISLLASAIYVVTWMFYYYIFVPDFIDQFTLHVLHMEQINGADATQIAAKKEEMLQFKEMYQNPLFVFIITIAEILPVGIVVTLVSAWILKKKAQSVPHH